MNLSPIAGFTLFYAFANSAFAEGRCPQGMAPYDTPGVSACVPTGGARSSGQGSQGSPSGHWQLTWGAIALAADGSDSVGASTGQLFELAAAQQAMKQCEQNGLRKCAIAITYQNQCTAMAFPVASAIGTAQVARAGSTALASQLALGVCKKHSKATCEILYQNCTTPVFQRF